MWAWGLGWTITFHTVLVPALLALGTGTLRVSREGAVSNEKTRVTVPAALTVGPAVMVRREGDPRCTWIALSRFSRLLAVFDQERSWFTRLATPSFLSPVVLLWTALGAWGC